ncbi:glycosyltransferase [Desulfurobacterium crinifex]
MKLKVLMVNKYLYPKGGAETYMFALADALKQKGIEVEFWGMRHKNNIIVDKYNSFVSEKDFSNLSSLDKFKYAVSAIYSIESKKKISKVLDVFRPDIVHLHNFNYQLTPSILPEVKKRDIKIVYTAHDSQLVCPYHRLYNFEKDSTCTDCLFGRYYKCLLNKCFEGSVSGSLIGCLEAYFYHIMDYYNRYIDLIISPSNFLAELLRKVYKRKIVIIPNFIDAPSFNKTTESQAYLLYIGRISKEKGIIDILSFFDKYKVPLKIIGTGSEVSKIRGSKYIEYLGPKFGKEKFKYIAKAKFTIQPSKWYENCPMTVIESFAVGTPVIASNQGGFIEMIEQGKNGFLIDFKSRNWEVDLLNSIKNYNSIMRECAYRTYLTKFRKDVHVKKILEIYKEVLNEAS